MNQEPCGAEDFIEMLTNNVMGGMKERKSWSRDKVVFMSLNFSMHFCSNFLKEDGCMLIVDPGMNLNIRVHNIVK